MSIDWGLGQSGVDNQYDYLGSMKALQAIGGQAIQNQTNQFQLQQAQRQAEIRPLIAQRIASGDLAGAQQQALSVGDTDTFKGINDLHDQHLQQLDREIDAVGSTAYALRQIQDPSQRLQAWLGAQPYLKQQGFSDQELLNVDLSNAGLDGYITHAQGVKQAVASELDKRQIAQKDTELAQGQRKLDLEAQNQAFEQSKPLSVGFGTSLVRPDGSVVYDGSGMGGVTTTAATQRTGGWTPIGPNSPQVVSNKIGTIAQTLGLDPNAPVPAAQLPRLAQAIAQTEGGPGDLNYRNNNPTNIMDGKFAKSQPGYVGTGEGGYAKFDSPQSGLNAATKLLQTYQGRGQNSINDIIMGKPIAGAPSAGGAGGMSAQAIDLAAREGLAHGGVVPSGYARNRAAQAAITNRMAELNAGGDVGALIQGGQTTKSQGQAFSAWNSGRPGTGAVATRSLSVAIDHIDQLGIAAQALQNGNTPLFNRIAQAYAQQTGSATPTNFDAMKRFVTDEVNKAIIGAGGGVADREEAGSILSRWQSPAQTQGAIQALHGLMAGQLHGLSQQYQATTGRNDFNHYVSPRALQVLGGQQGGQPQAPAGWKITRVN